jgi:hypothetical protein
MEKYLNKNGDSGVSHFEILADKIIVKFTGTIRTYTYSCRKAGVTHVNEMKILAINGSGLNSYINLHVKKLYD